jgi:Heparinase II/III-like protein/Heparinase II/III N-terminus
MDEQRGQLVVTPRGMRVVQTFAATLLALALVAISSGGGDPAAADDTWMHLRGAAALAAAPCPEADSIALPTASPARIEAARAGSFDVFGPKPTELSVPIDWSTDPLDAERYRQNLHKLRFLEPLLYSYASSHDVEDLRAALAIGLDWIRQNPRRDPATPLVAWSDKVIGDRTPYLAYLLRASACEGMLEARERGLLLASLEEHGRALAASKTFTPDNHGLFVDLGLLRLANSLPFFDQASSWRALSRKRFESTLRGRLSQGVWLEHSSAYQLLAIRALEEYMSVLGDDPELAELLAGMQAAAGWFVKPDGQITQFGDSNIEPVPSSIAERAAGLSGAQAYFGAGFAFVRAAGADGEPGYLAVTDGFHNLTHKHADELSFELFDHGTSIVTDTGLYAKDPGQIRDFVTSNRAHSTLTVDGLDLPISDPRAAYGSGLVAAGEGEGWYAIEGVNPLLGPQGVHHARLFLYRPGEALVIVDRVRAAAVHTYTRYLQLGPAVELGQASGGQATLTAPGLEGAVTDAPARPPATRSQARGQKEPMQGFTSPEFRELTPRWTLAYVDQAASEVRALSISLDANGLRATGAAAAGTRVEVDLVDSSGARTALVITRERRKLAVAPGP